jgi:hypothetical protein
MRPHPITSCFAALTLILWVETPANAQGTDQQRAACTPDVFRLCGAYIPDSDRITACLRGNGPRLSQPCYDVFFPAPPPSQYGSPQYAPRQYTEPRRRFQGPPRAPDYDDD